MATGQRGGAALRDVPLHQRVRGDGRGARQGHRLRLLRAQRRHLHPRQAPSPEPPILRRPGRPARRQVRWLLVTSLRLFQFLLLPHHLLFFFRNIAGALFCIMLSFLKKIVCIKI